MACVFLMLYLTSVLLVAMSSLEASWTPRYRYAIGRCQACAYDLAGLAERATCPECGRAEAASPIGVKTRHAVDQTVATRLIGVTLAAGGTALVFLFALPAIDRLSYILRGYRPDVAAAAHRVRGFDLPEAAWGFVLMASLVLAAPWLARIPPGVRFWPTVAAVLGGGTLLALALVAAALAIRYA